MRKSGFALVFTKRRACGGISLLLAAALAGCQSAPKEVSAAPVIASRPGHVSVPPDSPQLKHIAVGTVTTGEFAIDEVVAPGTVETNPNRISRVAVPVAGRIQQVFAGLGASIKQGQALATVDSVDGGEAIAAFRQAEAQARSAGSALNKTEGDLARLKDLYEHKAAALKDVQSAQNDFVQSQAAVEQAATARQAARHRLELLGLDPANPSPVVTVRSPISGKVLEISVVPGEYRNDTNAAMMTIADLSTVWIAASVPESLIRYIQIGEGVEVTLAAYPGEAFRARVMRIADVVEPQTRTVKVQVELANPGGRLRPEMFAQIRHSHGARSVPLIPSSAAIQAQGHSWVFVVEKAGEFERRAVQTGEESHGNLPVTSGLQPGEHIVTDGAMLLLGMMGAGR